MADHPVQPSIIMAHGGLLSCVVQVFLCAAGPHHLPPGHQNHHVTDVSYVGDRPQWQVHYRLLVIQTSHFKINHFSLDTTVMFLLNTAFLKWDLEQESVAEGHF